MRAIVNTFEPGEEQDLILKENETWSMDFLVEDVDVNGIATVVPLTGATIDGGIWERYDAPERLKAFTIKNRVDAAGTFTAELLVGTKLVPRNVPTVAMDLIVKLSSGRVIRVLAGYFTISRGVTPVP